MIFSSPGRGGIVGPVLALLSAVAAAAYLVLAQLIAASVPPAMSALWTAAGAGLSLTATWLVGGGALPGKALAPGGSLGPGHGGEVRVAARHHRAGRVGASLMLVAIPILAASPRS